MRFDGLNFIRKDGKVLGVHARQSKAGRWRFYDGSGKVIASGISPKQFVKEFWFAELIEEES